MSRMYRSCHTGTYLCPGRGLLSTCMEVGKSHVLESINIQISTLMWHFLHSLNIISKEIIENMLGVCESLWQKAHSPSL